MGCRLESYSDEVTLSLLEAAVRTGALLPAGSELDKLEKDPATTRFLGSKKKAASSVCLECDGVGEALLSRREPPCSARDEPWWGWGACLDFMDLLRSFWCRLVLGLASSGA